MSKEDKGNQNCIVGRNKQKKKHLINIAIQHYQTYNNNRGMMLVSKLALHTYTLYT